MKDILCDANNMANVKDKMKVGAENKLYVVKKYIVATCAAEAIKKDKTTDVHDVFVDGEWAGGRSPLLADSVGFHVSSSNQ